MDLAVGCRRLVVLMQHATKKGEHKLVARAATTRSPPPRIVSLVITELGVFEPSRRRLPRRRARPRRRPASRPRPLTGAPLAD